MYESITEKDIKQGGYLKVLEETESSLFPGYDLKQGFFHETEYCLLFDEDQVDKMVLKSLLLKPDLIDPRIEGKDVLTFYTKNYRNDHDAYWKRIIDDLGDHDEITILSKIDSRSKRVDILSFFKKLNWYRTFKAELSGILDEKDKRYIASKMVDRKYTLEQIKKMDLHPKVAMCFYDSAPEESIMMQYFKKIGAITITNQHGQPVFRSFDYDRSNQGQIINFKCDHYLAKGEMQRIQFEKAGFDRSRIKLIGIVGKRSKNVKVNKTGIFGVYLDFPGYSFSEESNAALIRVAKEIADKTGLKFFLKSHPAENIGKYERLVNDDRVRIYGKEAVLEETFDKAEFAIIHASSTYVDVYFYGMRCFKLDTDIIYPIAYEEDRVSSADGLIAKLKDWISLRIGEKEKYINKVRSLYDSGWESGNVKKIVNALLKAKESDMSSDGSG